MHPYCTCSLDFGFICILPVCFSSSHMFCLTKENTGHVVQQEILPHLVLVQNINMKKWALWRVNVCPLSIPAPDTTPHTSRSPLHTTPRLLKPLRCFSCISLNGRSGWDSQVPEQRKEPGPPFPATSINNQQKASDLQLLVTLNTGSQRLLHLSYMRTCWSTYTHAYIVGDSQMLRSELSQQTSACRE